MRKEVIFAIIIGLVLGAIILFGFRLAAQSARQAANTATASSQVVSPTPTIAVEKSLVLGQPLDHAVINTTSVKIAGRTTPQSAVAIQSDSDDALLTSDNNGNFTTDIKLSGGENIITITTLLPDEKTEAQSVSVVYSTAKLLSPADTVETPIASTSREIVDKTYEDILQNAKEGSKQTEAVLAAKANNLVVGYAGVISDIKQGVFSLDSRGQTLQITYDKTSAIIKDGAPIKAELIALADLAIVIGNSTGTDIIAAKRIVIYKETAPKFIKKTILAEIVKVDAKKKLLTLKIAEKNQEVSLGKLIKFDLTTLTVGQKIFGIIMTDAKTSATSLIQGKII